MKSMKSNCFKTFIFCLPVFGFFGIWQLKTETCDDFCRQLMLVLPATLQPFLRLRVSVKTVKNKFQLTSVKTPVKVTRVYYLCCDLTCKIQICDFSLKKVSTFLVYFGFPDSGQRSEFRIFFPSKKLSNGTEFSTA